ncbi:MAG: hypothetical protein JO322_11270 [Candidatus Eremiobacteraeota bacterium]|nr:hypothetical protein [Candidatus Eremiobacteraeota bacterium]
MALPATVSSLGALTQLQVFDTEMNAVQATAAASRVSWVWGAGAGRHGATAGAWLAGNPHLVPILYTYQGADNPNIDTNTIGGSHLAWFQANHPDWIVYDCDAQNRPTTTVAYQPGLPDAVPLDISNPAVVAYQMNVAAQAAIERSDSAVGADQTLFYDFDGGQKPGWYGCGVYTGPHFTGFIRRWGGNSGGFPNADPKWASDVATWVKMAKQTLVGRAAFLRHPLRLVINHPTNDPADPNEQMLAQYADANLDEAGFGGYGTYVQGGLLGRTLRSMTFWQAHGTFLVIDKFYPSDSGCCATARITSAQLSWAVASFLLGNLGHAAFYVTSGPYGVPSSFPEYATVNARIGTPCGGYARSGSLYVRRYSGGYVVANDSTSTVNATLPLPASAYVDMERRPVTNPLRVGGTEAHVLFSSSGC